LIETLPGTWVSVEPTPGEIITVTVDPTQLSCEEPGQTPGDACVYGFSPYSLVLSGTRLSIVSMGTTLVDGQVLNDGTRVEFDCYVCTPVHGVYEKQ